jgi:ferredoxin
MRRESISILLFLCRSPRTQRSRPSFIGTRTNGELTVSVQAEVRSLTATLRAERQCRATHPACSALPQHGKGSNCVTCGTSLSRDFDIIGNLTGPTVIIFARTRIERSSRLSCPCITRSCSVITVVQDAFLPARCSLLQRLTSVAVCSRWACDLHIYIRYTNLGIFLQH